jgi:hypothetical protein
MKDLEMNWTKLDPELKDKVLQYMVDGIFTKDNDYDFKKRFLAKLGIVEQKAPESKSTFGATDTNFNVIVGVLIAILVLIALFFLFDRGYKNKASPFAKIS